MKREAQQKQGKAPAYQHPGDATFSRFPELSRVLSDQWWDDGAPRDCPSLGIRLFQDRVHVSIVDLDKRRSTETTASSLFEALQLLETLCASPPLPWRLWGAKKGKRD